MSTDPQTSPQRTSGPIRRVGILFAGGPAPAANAVISTAAVSFLRHGVEVVGILHGYSKLVEYAEGRPLQEGRDYVMITHKMLKRTRSSRGIMIGTARTNPGKNVNSPADLADPEKSAPLRTAHAALESLGVDALISIGGDDTLKTGNKFLMVQRHLPGDRKRIAVVHVPKTIDNDYNGIDFTFGYFTAVEVIAAEIRNLLADAEATQSYYLVEAMGRSAGWLAYGAAIAGEASLVMSVEDLDEHSLVDEVDPETGKIRRVMKLDRVVGRIVGAMEARQAEGKESGVLVLAEGLAEYLPAEHLKGIPRDDHGHIAIAQVQLNRKFAKLIGDEFRRRTGIARKVTGLQLGYEARCAQPNAFDVMLGSQLGVGAYRALAEERRSGVMVSVSGQLQLDFVPFEELVDQETLVTVVRRIKPGSDFHRLARFLETYIHG
jgi:6-phosphofructokinase 1